MSFNALRHMLAALMVSLLAAACGGSGDRAAAPTGGITVTPGDGKVTVTWNADPNVKYWLFYAPGNSISTTDFITIPGARAIMNVTSPYVVTGLVNGYPYSFAMNGRTGDGPGGTGTAVFTVSPRPAGVTWNSGGAMGTQTMRSLTYGLNSADNAYYYLGVGDGGQMAKSLDGISWTSFASPTTYQLRATTYTLGKFLTVGMGGTIYYATDLSNWIGTASNTTANLNAMASNGVTVVTVGDSGTIRLSTDGITWTTVPSPTSKNLYGVSYSGAGKWVAVGAGGTVLTSTDAATWTQVDAGVSVDLNAVTVQASTIYNIVAVGNGGTVVRSTDSGVTWSTYNAGTTNDLTAVSSYYYQVLAVGKSGTVSTSTDATSWTLRSSGTSVDLLAILHGFSQYVVAGSGGISINSQ